MFKTLKKEEFFVSPANGSLVVILITIGDVTNVFAIGHPNRFIPWQAPYLSILSGTILVRGSIIVAFLLFCL